MSWTSRTLCRRSGSSPSSDEQKDSVIDHLRGTGKKVDCVEQTPQLGTGHAVMQAEKPLEGFNGDVLVLSGDVPLLTMKTVQRLLDHHRSSPAAATVLTAVLPDATGYGRILRANSTAMSRASWSTRMRPRSSGRSGRSIRASTCSTAHICSMGSNISPEQRTEKGVLPDGRVPVPLEQEIAGPGDRRG